jgi:hypothetical protein
MKRSLSGGNPSSERSPVYTDDAPTFHSKMLHCCAANSAGYTGDQYCSL